MAQGSSAEDSTAGLQPSVVIPCLNAAATLGEQLEALACQNFEGEIEVIVADNGSTDNSRQIAERYRSRIPRLKVVDASSRAGPAHARNAGAAVATGDLLLFCDSDDRVALDWVRAMTAALRDHVLVASRYETRQLNPGPIGESYPASPQESGLNPYTNPPFLAHAGGGGLGVRRSVHDALGGFDETMLILEDTDYCWRAQLAGYELRFAKEAVVHVRYRTTLKGVFRQALTYGEFNVLIYVRYRQYGMPWLSPLPGLLKTALLLVCLPRILSRSHRARWVSLAGWRLGRWIGCVKYRTLAL